MMTNTSSVTTNRIIDIVQAVSRNTFGINDTLIAKSRELRGKSNQPAYRSKKYKCEEEYMLALNKADISDGIFSYEMYTIECDFEELTEENIHTHISEEVEDPLLKRNRVLAFLDMLLDKIEDYENNRPFNVRELDFFCMYVVFCAFMDELQGTSREQKVQEYKMLFENIYSVK